VAGPLLFDRVRERTATTGTGSLALSGAVQGYQSFAVVGNGNSCYYTVSDLLGNWEVGAGTYTAATTSLSRDTVLASSNGGAKVDFPAGTKNVWLDAPASFLSGLGGGGPETDPVFSASPAAGITALEITHWDTAYGWGNHAAAGYFVKAADTLDAISEGSTNKHLTSTLKTYYNAAYSHKLIEDALSGLIKCNGSGTYTTVTDSSANWNTAYGWGNHASAGYALAANVVPYTGASGDLALGTHNLTTTTGSVSPGVLTLPNGAAVSLAAVGQIGLDTTDNALVVHDGTSDKVYAHPVQVLNFSIAKDATAGWDNQTIPLSACSKDMAITILQVDLTAMGTSTPTLACNVEERAFGSYNSAGTAITASAMTATGTGLSQTDFSNAAVAARAGLFLTTGASAESGTVNFLMGTIYFMRDRE
jgi:hypothetical protein